MQIKEPQDHSIRIEKTTTTIQTILKMHRYKINAALCHNLRDLTTLVFQGSTCTIYNNTELYTTYVNIAWLCCRFYRFMLPGKSQLYQFSGYKESFLVFIVSAFLYWPICPSAKQIQSCTFKEIRIIEPTGILFLRQQNNQDNKIICESTIEPENIECF